jgi:hypothetical protein
MTNITFASWFSLILFFPIKGILTQDDDCLGGSSRSFMELSMAIIQSLFLPRAVIEATLDRSEETFNCRSGKLTVNEVAGVAEFSHLSKNMRIIFDSFYEEDYGLDDSPHEQSLIREESQSRMISYCDHNCSSRSRKPSNPEGFEKGTQSRW